MLTINFDKAKATALVKQYNENVTAGQEVFTFEGKELYIGYARYMIEYLILNQIIDGKMQSDMTFKLKK